MSYDKMMKWNSKHIKGTKQTVIMHTSSGFTPSKVFLDSYFEYRNECKNAGIVPESCEYYYHNKTECRKKLNEN